MVKHRMNLQEVQELLPIHENVTSVQKKLRQNTETTNRDRGELQELRHATDIQGRIIEEAARYLQEKEREVEEQKEREINTRQEAEQTKNDLRKLRVTSDQNNQKLTQRAIQKLDQEREEIHALRQQNERERQKLQQMEETLNREREEMRELRRQSEREIKMRQEAEQQQQQMEETLNREREEIHEVRQQNERERNMRQEAEQERNAARARVDSMAVQMLNLRRLNEQIYTLPDWAISREEIQLTSKILGVGAYATVFEGIFRGSRVAVKRIHDLIRFNSRILCVSLRER